MLKLLICASILIVLVGADYNFQDADFNELVFEDLTSQESEPLRFKRGARKSAECHRKKDKPAHCCNGEKASLDDKEAFKEVKRSCAAEARAESENEDSTFDPLSCESIQQVRRQLVCASECMAKKFGLLTSNGDFKRDALLNHTRKMIGANKWKNAVLEEYVDECLNELKASKQAGKNNGSCNPKPLEFHHCTWKKFIEGCPAELQVDSSKCRAIRNRLASGDTSSADKSLKRYLYDPEH